MNKKQIERLTHRLASRYVPDFSVEIEFSDKAEGENIAETSLYGMGAKVTFYPEIFLVSGANQEHVVAHEVAHMFISPLASAAENVGIAAHKSARAGFAAILSDAEESLCDRLAGVFLGRV